MSQVTNKVCKPNVKKALLTGVREGYFNLGFVVFASAFTSLVTLLLAWGMIGIIGLLNINKWQVQALFYLIPTFACFLCCVGIYDYTFKCLTHQNPVIMDAVWAIRDLWKSAIKLFFADLFISAVLVSDVIYCWMLAVQNGGLLFWALTVFVYYLLLMWTVVMMYHLPILSGSEDGASVRFILKRSLALAFGNPVYTFVVGLGVVVLALVCALPAFAGWIAVLIGGTAFITCSATKELYITYGILPEDIIPKEDPGWNIEEKTPKGLKKN